MIIRVSHVFLWKVCYELAGSILDSFFCKIHPVCYILDKLPSSSTNILGVSVHVPAVLTILRH